MRFGTATATRRGAESHLCVSQALGQTVPARAGGETGQAGKGGGMKGLERKRWGWRVEEHCEIPSG